MSLRADQTEVGGHYRWERMNLTRIEGKLEGIAEGVVFVNQNHELVRLEPDTALWPGGFAFEEVDLNNTPYHRDRNASEFFHDTMLPVFGSLMTLKVIVDNVHERMKELAAETLKPGSDDVIEDLSSLDYIWLLPGSRCFEGGKPAYFSALDYYLGRRVSHVWGEGPLVRIVKDRDRILDCDLEHFGEQNILVRPKLATRGIHHGVKLDYPCTCGKVKYEMFAIPGVHLGGFAYLVCEDQPEMTLDVRNHCRVCEDCAAGVREANERIERGA